ncbi:hypothetical protein AgCh_017193 [Apium graveolens]
MKEIREFMEETGELKKEEGCYDRAFSAQKNRGTIDLKLRPKEAQARPLSHIKFGRCLMLAAMVRFKQTARKTCDADASVRAQIDTSDKLTGMKSNEILVSKLEALRGTSKAWFQDFLLDWNAERRRNITVDNLNKSGFHDWEKLRLRLKIPFLYKDNYHHWKVKMHLHLLTQDEELVDCIEKGPHVPMRAATGNEASIPKPRVEWSDPDIE